MLDNDYENQINNGIASSFLTMHYGPAQDSTRLLMLVVDDRFPIVFNEIEFRSLLFWTYTTNFPPKKKKKKNTYLIWECFCVCVIKITLLYISLFYSRPFILYLFTPKPIEYRPSLFTKAILISFIFFLIITILINLISISKLFVYFIVYI